MKLSLIHANSRKKLTLNESSEVILGRGATDIPELEDDSKLSRQHLKCFFDEGNKCFVVLDLGSTNGSYLNHERMEVDKAYQIHVGDIIVFGNQTLEVETIWDDSKILKNTSEFTGKPSINLEASVTQEMTVIDHTLLSREFTYEGKAKELLILSLKNAFLCLVSLGFYIPYAKVNLRKHIWSNTKFGADSFSFSGTGWELLRSYLLFFGLIFAIGGAFWGISSYFGLNWIDFARNFTEGLGFEALGLVFAFLFISVVIALFYICFIFYMQFGTMRYLLTRTKLRSLYFNLDSSMRLNFIVSSLGGMLLTLFTFGLYYPFFKARQLKYLWNYASYGSQKFNFEGTGKDYAIIFLKTSVYAITLSILAGILEKFLEVLFEAPDIVKIAGVFFYFGTYFLIHAHFKAASLNYLVNNLKVQEATFSSNFTTFQLVRLNFVNYLLIILTLGLATPVIFIRNMSYYVKKIKVHGAIDFDVIEMRAKDTGGEFAETLADVFDFELSW